MKINYGVYKKDVESFNGKLEGEFDWDSDEDHKKIRQLIKDKHPGFSIHGYCIAPEHQKECRRCSVCGKFVPNETASIMITPDSAFTYEEYETICKTCSQSARDCRDKEPYGPMESDLTVHLIGQQILFANHKDGLGTYGVLESVQFGEPAPYYVISCTGSKIRCKWIVKRK